MTFRERPYSQFNFQVDFGVDPNSPQAGFQEVTGLGLEITATDYRNGNELVNAPRKITGLHKVTDVTLKRGVIGDDTLYQWLNEVRNGAQDALRTVTIQLLSEDRSVVAQTWELRNARPTKITGPQFNGKASDIAMEEVHLTLEELVEVFA